jgi:hypothetical protein
MFILKMKTLNNCGCGIFPCHDGMNKNVFSAFAFYCAAVSLYVVCVPNIGFAFDEKSGSASIQSDSVPTKSPLRSPMIDPTVMNRYMDYLGWMDSAVAPLANEAIKNGVTVSKEETELQAKAIKAAFPNMPVFELELTNAALARKYSQSIMGSSASDNEKKKAYQEIKSTFPEEISPTAEQLNALIETKALLNYPLVNNMATRLKENERIVEQRARNSEEMWTLDEMRFSTQGESCLAKHRDSSQCQLTVAKYNNLVKFQSFTKEVPLDTARRMAIRSMLWDCYLLDNARRSGFVQSDTAQWEAKSILNSLANNAGFKGTEIPVNDYDMLALMYSRYYDPFFRKKVKPFYSIIGSNDSSTVDSMLRIAKTARERSRPEKGLDDSISEPALPWSHSCGASLPEEFKPFADTLPIGEVSDVFRTSYGYFIARFDSVQTTPEVSIEEAYDKLVLLATKQKWFALDSVLQDKAYKIYAANRRLNTTQDTFSLISFLSPAMLQDSIYMDWENKRSSGKQAQKKSSLPAMEKGVKISSVQLPIDICDSLITRYAIAGTHKKSETLGPLRTRYGVWHFKILSVKTGSAKIPFSSVGKALIDSLVVAKTTPRNSVWFEKPDNETVEMAIALAYKIHFFDPDITEQPVSSTIDGNTIEKGNDALVGRLKPYKTRLSELLAWINKVEIRIP